MISIILNDFFGGVGSVGSPESFKMYGFPHIFIISSVEWEAWEIQNHSKCIECIHLFIIYSVEWEAWEAQNHCKCMDYHTFFMISSVEWEAWEDQNHLKYIDFMRFQNFVRWSGKRGKPRITKYMCFFLYFPKQIGGVGSVRNLESLKIQRFLLMISSVKWETCGAQNQ